MKTVKVICVAVAPLLLAVGVYADVQECWQAPQDRDGENWLDAEYDLAMAVDNDGNVYVTHPRWNGTDSDIVTKKLDPNGDVVWETLYDGGAISGGAGHPGDVPHDIAVTGSQVCVTGQSLNCVSGVSGNDYITIRYSAASGTILWDDCYDHAEEDDEAFAIAITSAPCITTVFVTGESKDGPDDSDNDVATIRYNILSGNREWVKRYEGPFADYATSILVDGCNVYVGGATWRLVTLSFDYLVLSYSSGGIERWPAKFWDGPGHIEGCAEIIHDMTICNGILYATGQACGGIGTGLDYGTIARDCADGNLIGEAVYGGAGEDVAWGIAADSSCCIYVTGKDEDGGDDFLATVKYDWLLHEVATNTYPDRSQGRDIAVDDCDFPYATGWGIYDNVTNPSEYLTIKYEQHDPGDPTDFDREWAEVQYHPRVDEAYAIATYGCETVYVAGESEGDDYELDIVTKKYSERGACFDCETETCVDNVAGADCQGEWQVWDQCGVCNQFDPPYPEICTIGCCLPDNPHLDCVEMTVIECNAEPGAIPNRLGTTCPLMDDCDDDCDVDLTDFFRFQTCYTGPGGGPLPPECVCCDCDFDDDVDLADFFCFQVNYTGPR